MIANTHSINSLRELNLKLLAEITKLKKENAKVKVENIKVKVKNIKLRHALKEHKARFTSLEHKNKEKTNLITKLDDDIRKIKQELNAVNILAQSNISISKSPIYLITLQLSILPPIENHSNHSIKKNNTDPISQNFNSIPLD